MKGDGLQSTDCACAGKTQPIPPAAASKIKIPGRGRDNGERPSARCPCPPLRWHEASSETTTS
ncbi:hypothetical protein GCM10027021_42140 [Dyella kyungheensis]